MFINIQPILMINILVIHVPPCFSISWFLKPPFLASNWFPIARSLIAWLGSVGASGAVHVALPRGSRVRASCLVLVHHGRGTKTGLSLTWQTQSLVNIHPLLVSSGIAYFWVHHIKYIIRFGVLNASGDMLQVSTQFMSIRDIFVNSPDTKNTTG